MHRVRTVPGAGVGERGQLHFLAPGKNRLKQGEVRAKEPALATGAGGGEEGRWAPTVFLTEKEKKKKKKDDE